MLKKLNFVSRQIMFDPIVLTGFGFPLWHMKWTALKTRKKGLPYLWGCSYSQCLLFQTQILYLCMQNTDSHVGASQKWYSIGSKNWYNRFFGNIWDIIPLHNAQHKWHTLHKVIDFVQKDNRLFSKKSRVVWKCNSDALLQPWKTNS